MITIIKMPQLERTMTASDFPKIQLESDGRDRRWQTASHGASEQCVGKLAVQDPAEPLSRVAE